MEANIFTNVILPVSLAIIMLGLGMGLTADDFRRVGCSQKHLQRDSSLRWWFSPSQALCWRWIIRPSHFRQVGLAMLLLNVLTLFIAYNFARLLRLPLRQRLRFRSRAVSRTAHSPF